MANIAIVFHSGFGHTAVQAQAVARGAQSANGSKVDLVPVQEVDQHWDTLDAADAIIFGSPTYMGSVSAPMKEFMDKSSKVWQQQTWRNKIAAGFTNSASWSGDKLNSLVTMGIFAMQHGMIWVGLDLLPGNNHSKGSPQDLNRVGGFFGAMAQSNADQGPDVVPPVADQKTAEHLGKRVAELAAKFATA
jgi:NAD(P)H dehydrogenase (quinone)